MQRLRFTASMYPDTRDEASAWLVQTVEQGSWVLATPYAPVLAPRHFKTWPLTADRAAKRILKRQPGAKVIVMSDFYTARFTENPEDAPDRAAFFAWIETCGEEIVRFTEYIASSRARLDRSTGNGVAAAMLKLRLLAIAALGAGLLPGVAFAQTGPGSLVSVRTTRIDVKATPGRNNVILVFEANGLVSIADASGGAGVLQATPLCTANAGVVTCPIPPKLRIVLGDGDDTVVNLTSIRLVVKGGSGSDSIYGGSGDDDLRGDSGNDFLYGGDGADELRGGTGDDVLEGGAGPDLFIGQGGSDTVSYANPITWPVVTRDRLRNDGVPGEGDNVLPSVEQVDVHPFNFRADEAVVPRGGSLSVATETWPAAGDFDLETRREVGIQVVGYYDADGRMRAAARRIGEATWVHTPPLPTMYEKSWDQHRYLELAFDPDGRLHMIGNLHGFEIDPSERIVVCCSPLQYFRTQEPVDDPEDVLTLTRSAMLSPSPDVPLPFEDVTTYAGFFTDGERFFFIYRDGWSNAGEWYVHQMDRVTGQWFNPNGNEPWYSGVRGAAPAPPGSVNPQTAGFYFNYGFDQERFWIAGYDAWLYASNCGAEAVDGRCALSYVSTAEFDHFYDVSGVELQTPIQPATRSAAAIVDPAPYGGLWGIATGFDEQGHPMLVYGRHAASRLDAGDKLEGNYQAYFARWNGSQWQRVQLSNWSQWTKRSPSLAVIPSIVGPIADTNGVPRWYVRMTVFDEPNTRTTGWLRIDLDTLVTEPAPPSFQPPTTNCESGTTAMQQPPVQYPDWVEPLTSIRLIPRVRRSNTRPRGMGEEASSYYYLSWNATDAEPVPAATPETPQLTEPPPIALSVRRTTCVK